MKNLVKNNLWSFLLIAIGAGWSIFVYKQLPDSIATHFDMNGNPDGFSSKNFAVSLMPLVSFTLVLMMHGLMIISPEKFAAKQSSRSIAQLILAIVTFLTALHFAMLYSAVYHEQIVGPSVSIGLSLLIVFIGNYMGKIEQNFWVGIRTPWTLASEDNWKRTQRFTGHAFVISGLIALAFSIWIHTVAAPMAALILASLLGVIYSYRYYVKYEKVDRRTEI